MYNTASVKQPGLIERCDPYKDETISSKVQELDLDELWQANRLLQNSEALHQLNRINELLKAGYKFNSLEQKIFDKFFENYNVNYKSPLAEALKEDE